MATAATLTSATLENQMLEVIELISRKQQDTATNPNGVTVITAASRNDLTGIKTVTISVPTTDKIDASGGNVVVAEEVFTD